MGANSDPRQDEFLRDRYTDPDALNTLLTPRTNDPTDAVTMSFTYDGVRVRADSDGWVDVHLDGTDHD